MKVKLVGGNRHGAGTVRIAEAYTLGEALLKVKLTGGNRHGTGEQCGELKLTHGGASVIGKSVNA